MHNAPGLHERLSALYTGGELAIEQGRLAEAVALFTEGLQLDDQYHHNQVTMYALRAFARQRLGDHMGAIPDYGRAIEMEPPANQAQYYYHRAMCFTAIGGHEEHAVADCGRSIAIFPDHPGPYHLRGKLYASDLGRYEDAIADFDWLLNMTQVAEGYQLRGYAKLNLGRAHDAIPDLLAARQLEQDTYTDYLLAWAGAVAHDDELFYHSMHAVLVADAAGYQSYFLNNNDYARLRDQPRFRQIFGM